MVETTYADFELRRYAPMLVVETAGDSRNAAFRRLFNCIAGGDLAQQKIETTAPVVMNPPASTSERIEMTSPVLVQPPRVLSTARNDEARQALTTRKSGRVQRAPRDRGMRTSTSLRQ